MDSKLEQLLDSLDMLIGYTSESRRCVYEVEGMLAQLNNVPPSFAYECQSILPLLKKFEDKALEYYTEIEADIPQETVEES